METPNKTFDVIIIGGSYSGLAAALALGRALMNVLIIDGAEPCNKQTPHSHNFLTQDGKKPAEIHKQGKEQVLMYNTVEFLEGVAVAGRKMDDGTFEIQVSKGEIFRAGQLIFATGIKDDLSGIPGLAECWGISVIHCPYCHGYEVRNEPTGILSNGPEAIEIAGLISNWTKDLTILTNGEHTFSEEEELKLKKHDIKIDERTIAKLKHDNGYLSSVTFQDGSELSLKAIYYRPTFVQHCQIPQALGCELTEEGYIKVDSTQATSIKGIFACGDNVTRMRAVANAVFMGTMAGVAASRQLILDRFSE
ncbi:NAD(P)/FAD-dependent oxidoreductase [Desertivirga brevis]|uniref:NAD(P)/FAD-dependent oxidoreductase n=1 Tax=Desertivirga brevis TaxID=2810310 RepID=UPI001A96BAC8|nr:NAD(P)/FAD-dependent oxidoreductase [Pedobacter sp. SYSU D00873]